MKRFLTATMIAVGFAAVANAATLTISSDKTSYTVGEAIVWIEELVDYAEKSASSPVYPLLKRDDERHVTMHAFDNPAFVEDIARNAAVKLRADERISSFSIRVVNHESIHNHSAFAHAIS